MDRTKTGSRTVAALQGEVIPLLDIDKAMAEITNVSAPEIHRAAALTWAARAIAGYRVSQGQSPLHDFLSYFYLGEHYREAALAHAAMGDGWQALHAEIDHAMAKDRAEAFDVMQKRSAEAGGRPRSTRRRKKSSS